MPLDLQLEYIGGGQFRCLTKLDFDLCTRELQQGDKLRAKVSKKRSVRQNDFFHALVQSAFDNQRSGPKIAKWEHLKSWLLIEVGHCDEVRFSIGHIRPDLAMLVAGGMARAFRERFEYMAAGIDQKRGEIVLRFPRSVSFKAANSDEMAAIVDRAVAIICTQIVPGCDPETILNMAKAKAA